MSRKPARNGTRIRTPTYITKIFERLKTWKQCRSFIQQGTDMIGSTSEAALIRKQQPQERRRRDPEQQS